MNIIMVLFSLVKHEKTSRNGQIRKIIGNFSENIRTNWTGFIRQWTGLILQRTGLIRRRIIPVRRRIKLVRRRIKPVCQQIKPVHLVLIFVLIFLFSQLFAHCQQRELYHHNQRSKLRSYVDLLNYPCEMFTNHKFRLRIHALEQQINQCNGT